MHALYEIADYSVFLPKYQNLFFPPNVSKMLNFVYTTNAKDDNDEKMLKLMT